MNMKSIIGASFAAVLISTGAHAATITNNEANPQTITVFTAEAEKTFTIAPSDMISLDQLCPDTCVLALKNGDEFEFANGEKMTLEDGGIYLSPPAQGSDGTDKPVQQ